MNNLWNTVMCMVKTTVYMCFFYVSVWEVRVSTRRLDREHMCVHDLSEDVKLSEFMSASVCALTFVYMCLPVSARVCVCVLASFRLWSSPGGLPLLLLFFAVRRKTFLNICTTYHHSKKKKEDTGLKLSSGRAHGFHFIGLFLPWYAWSSWGNLKRSQNVIHLLKMF